MWRISRIWCMSSMDEAIISRVGLQKERERESVLSYYRRDSPNRCVTILLSFPVWSNLCSLTILSNSGKHRSILNKPRNSTKKYIVQIALDAHHATARGKIWGGSMTGFCCVLSHFSPWYLESSKQEALWEAKLEPITRVGLPSTISTVFLW